jgi:hypothetical protein
MLIRGTPNAFGLAIVDAVVAKGERGKVPRCRDLSVHAMDILRTALC